MQRPTKFTFVSPIKEEISSAALDCLGLLMLGNWPEIRAAQVYGDLQSLRDMMAASQDCGVRALTWAQNLLPKQELGLCRVQEVVQGTLVVI